MSHHHATFNAGAEKHQTSKHRGQSTKPNDPSVVVLGEMLIAVCLAFFCAVALKHIQFGGIISAIVVQKCKLYACGYIV